MVSSSRQLSNTECGLYLDGWPVFKSSCWPCDEVLGKPLISYCLCPPSSSGYLVEQESYIVVIGYSCSKVSKWRILPKGDETVLISNTRGLEECKWSVEEHEWISQWTHLNLKNKKKNEMHISQQISFLLRYNSDFCVVVIQRSMILTKAREQTRISYREFQIIETDFFSLSAWETTNMCSSFTRIMWYSLVTKLCILIILTSNAL